MTVCDTHPLREHSTYPHPSCALEVAQRGIHRPCLPRGLLCCACRGPCCLDAMLAVLRQLSTLAHSIRNSFQQRRLIPCRAPIVLSANV